METEFANSTMICVQSDQELQESQEKQLNSEVETKLKKYEEIMQQLKSGEEMVQNCQEQYEDQEKRQQESSHLVAKLEQQNESRMQLIQYEIYHRDQNVETIVEFRNKLGILKELDSKFKQAMTILQMELNQCKESDIKMRKDLKKLYAETDYEILKLNEEQNMLKNQSKNLRDQFKFMLNNFEIFRNEKSLEVASKEEYIGKLQNDLKDFELTIQEIINKIKINTSHQNDLLSKIDEYNKIIDTFRSNKIEKTQKYEQKLQNFQKISTKNREKIEKLKNEITTLENGISNQNDFLNDIKNQNEKLKMEITEIDLNIESIKNEINEIKIEREQEEEEFKNKKFKLEDVIKKFIIEIKHVTEENFILEEEISNSIFEQTNIEAAIEEQTLVIFSKEYELKELEKQEIKIKDNLDEDLLKLQSLIREENDVDNNLSLDIETCNKKIVELTENLTKCEAVISEISNTKEIQNNLELESINEANKQLQKNIEEMEIKIKDCKISNSDKIKEFQRQQEEVIRKLTEKNLMLKNENERTIKMNELTYKKENDALNNTINELGTKIEQKKEENQKLKFLLDSKVQYLAQINNEIEKLKIPNTDKQILKEITPLSNNNQDLQNAEAQNELNFKIPGFHDVKIPESNYSSTSSLTDSASDWESTLKKSRLIALKKKQTIRRKPAKRSVNFAAAHEQKSKEEIFNSLLGKETNLQTQKGKSTKVPTTKTSRKPVY